MPLAFLLLIVTVGSLIATLGPDAYTDNKRLADGVITHAAMLHQRFGCTGGPPSLDPLLQRAARWHAVDVANNRSLDGDVGTDGSTPRQRAQSAGFRGSVAETVWIDSTLAFSGLELLKQWYFDSADLTAAADCSFTAIGVWSTNHDADRTVVVAVYGRPE
ncbi:hypothetical protein Y900_028915 [Mycolicibacterium aromaticivorans JS19b1 = JCM 16368]|uniref:SCP domain-containing protein n=1 Tax=Mycolicibacterium aromaticivorans JS19b1 = JCM 16368 TaxID=1440774 RepID=A0A064CEX5_9MYCO|nr:hypothetical protein Y900_028915 [Mycolicibacterium aromaticivorans JS19b1 = JCM 16368]